MNPSGGARSCNQMLRTKLIAAFSTYLVENPHEILQLKTIPELETIFLGLLDDLVLSEDAWSRYFLLTMRQQDPDLLQQLSLTTPATLADLIQQIIALTAEAANHTVHQEVRVIHRQVVVRSAAGFDTLAAPFGQQPSNYTSQFLFVYLQKIVWYAVRDYYHKVIERTTLAHQYRQDDLRDRVLDKAQDPAHFLANFCLIKPVKIKTYTNHKVTGLIRDRIRQDNFAERIRSMSDAGLLRRCSQRQLGKALKALRQLPLGAADTPDPPSPDRSHSQAKVIACYLQVIALHNQIHQPLGTGRDRLPSATDEQLQCIADRYNQASSQPGSVCLTSADIKAILDLTVRAVRDYYVNPDIHSLDEPLRSDDPKKPDPTWELPQITESFLEQLINQEEQAAIALSVDQAFATLAPLAQTALYLWYGLEFDQTMILDLLGSQLKVNQQYGVSRRIKRFKSDLLQALAQSWKTLWETTYARPMSPEALADLMALPVIDDYLALHCRRIFYPPLEETLTKIARQHPDLNLGSATQRRSFYPDMRAALREVIQQQCHLDLQVTDLLDLKVEAKLDRLIETWFQ